MRRYQLATAAVLIVIAAVAMFDTRGGALPDPSGGAPGGLKGGWYPFWSAALMALAAAVVAYMAYRTPVPATGTSMGRKGVLALLLLIVPMIAAVVAMVWLGFYLVSLLYVAFFTAVVGRYRPHWVAATAVGMTAAIYIVFELGFRVPLPKSVFSKMGFPF